MGALFRQRPVFARTARQFPVSPPAIPAIPTPGQEAPARRAYSSDGTPRGDAPSPEVSFGKPILHNPCYGRAKSSAFDPKQQLAKNNEAQKPSNKI